MSSALKPYSLKLFLSNKYTYAQIVRKADGHIVAAASTIEKSLRQDLSSTSDKVGSTKYVDMRLFYGYHGNTITIIYLCDAESGKF